MTTPDEIINALARGRIHPRALLRFHDEGHFVEWTGSAFHDRAMRLATRLQQLGVKPGDRVGVLGQNRAEWMLADLACIALGATVASLDAKADLTQQDFVAACRMRLLLTDDPLHLHLPFAHELRQVCCELDEVAPLRDTHRYRAEDAICLKFTSGSTGRPKGLLASVGSIESSLQETQRMFAHGEGDNILVFLPLSLLQQRYWVYSALYFGHETTVCPYELVFKAMLQTRPTVIMGVPGFYETLQKLVALRANKVAPRGSEPQAAQVAVREAFEGISGGRVRYMWTGSAPCAPSLVEYFAATGAPLFNGYGLNETCIVAKNHLAAHRLGSVGRVIGGKTVSFDAQGQIFVRSQFPVGSRYEISFGADDNELFVGPDLVATGDVGHLDADGYLFVTGRLKDLLVLQNGQSVQPSQIEHALRRYEAIDFVLVCGNDRPFLTALVCSSQPAELVQRCVDEVNATLPASLRVVRHAVVPAVDFSDRTLFTSQLKPIRRSLQERFRSDIQTLYKVTT